jgi:hypothetical protein
MIPKLMGTLTIYRGNQTQEATGNSQTSVKKAS